MLCIQIMGRPWWLSSKESPPNAGDTDLIAGSGRFPGERNGNQLQYSCLGNSTDRWTWQATVQRVIKESAMTERLNNNNSNYEWSQNVVVVIAWCFAFVFFIPVAGSLAVFGHHDSWSIQKSSWVLPIISLWLYKLQLLFLYLLIWKKKLGGN